MKKQVAIIIPLLSFCLCSCGGVSTYELHTKDQLDYINDTYDSIAKYTSGTSVDGNPKPVTIKYGSLSNVGKLYVSEEEDYSSSTWTFDLASGSSSFDLYNSKMGTTYYYKVESGSKIVKTGSYRTANTFPRNLYVEGAKNIRDLGFEDVIKQGLLYRGGEFDYMHGSSMKVSIKEAGIKTLVEQIGIKTEIDLRALSETNDTASPLGETVTYISKPMCYTGKENILTYKDDSNDNPKMIKEVFEVLSNKDNYPVYFHCAKGKDRTGLISYLVKAIMGQDEEDIYKDYLFTNFTFQNAVQLDSILSSYVIDINNTAGQTLKQKTMNYLTSEIGVSLEQIESIQNILAF